MEKFNKEEYLKILEAESHLEEKLEEVRALKKAQEELLDSTFSESLEDDSIEISENVFRIKKIGTSIDTDGFILDMQTELLDKYGEETGEKLYNVGFDSGVTIRKSYNRSKFLNGIKAEAKQLGFDITEMIKAAEENNSEKTIKFITKDITKEKGE